MDKQTLATSGFKQSIQYLALTVLFVSYAQTASANLPANATLNLDTGTHQGPELPVSGSGSWFTMG